MTIETQTASAWRDQLEDALEQLGHIGRLLENGAPPVADLRSAADAIVASHAALFEAYDLLVEPALALRRALTAVTTARSLLVAFVGSSAALGFAIDYCDQTIRVLARAEELAFGQLLPAHRASGPLCASTSNLRLHTLDRPRFVPTLTVPEARAEVVARPNDALPAPGTFEELESAIAELRRRADEQRARAEETERARRSAGVAAKELTPPPPPGFASDRLRASSPTEFTRQRARECFEEIVMVGIQRTPLEGDDWRSMASLERRLLANLDALVALGPVALAQIEPVVMDFPIRDPARVWAAGIVFGSVHGRDALAVVERIFFASEPSAPESAHSLAAAWKLVRHPSLERVLRRLLSSSAPSHRALAISVLAHQGLATSNDLVRASQDVPQVAAQALPFCALSGHPSARHALDAALAHSDLALREAALTSALYAQHPRAQDLLRAELRGPSLGLAAHLLAVSASEREYAELE